MKTPDVVIVFLLLTLKIFHTLFFCIYTAIVDFKQVNTSWVNYFLIGSTKKLNGSLKPE